MIKAQNLTHPGPAATADDHDDEDDTAKEDDNDC
jgi:hypothetical protein